MSSPSTEEIFVTIKRMGFIFLHDRKVQHNLVSPAFLSFFMEGYCANGSLEDNRKEAEEIFNHGKDAFPPPHELSHHNPFAGVLKKCGNKKIVKCSDNKFRMCRAFEISFQIDDEPFTKVFYLDRALWCTRHTHVLIGDL